MADGSVASDGCEISGFFMSPIVVTGPSGSSMGSSGSFAMIGPAIYIPSSQPFMSTVVPNMTTVITINAKMRIFASFCVWA